MTGLHLCKRHMYIDKSIQIHVIFKLTAVLLMQILSSRINDGYENNHFNQVWHSQLVFFGFVSILSNSCVFIYNKNRYGLPFIQDIRLLNYLNFTVLRVRLCSYARPSVFDHSH